MGLPDNLNANGIDISKAKEVYRKDRNNDD